MACVSIRAAGVSDRAAGVSSSSSERPEGEVPLLVELGAGLDGSAVVGTVERGVGRGRARRGPEPEEEPESVGGTEEAGVSTLGAGATAWRKGKSKDISERLL